MLDKIDPCHLSYIIGFLQGDGHHREGTRNRGRISIELSYKDNDLLRKIKMILDKLINVTLNDRTRDTNFLNNYHCQTLAIHDWAFRTAIKPYVPVGRKSDIIEPPLALPNFSKRDYIRGLVDADGAVGVRENGQPFIALCVSSEKIKEYFLDDIFQVTGLKKDMNRNTRDNVYNIMLNNEEAIIYATHLYKDSTLYLDRKYLKYQDMLSWERTVRKRTWASTKWTEAEDIIVRDVSISLKEKIKLLGRTDRSIGMRWYRLNGKDY